MALIQCPECEKEVSSKAEKCPHCGVEIKKKTSFGAGCALVLIILVVIVIATSGGGGSGSSTTPGKTQKTATVSIAYSSTAIQLTNTGTKDWSEVVIYINGQPPFTYKATMVAPALGEMIEIPLNRFTEKDGTRFNPQTHALTEIWIGGGGYDFERYKISR